MATSRTVAQILARARQIADHEQLGTGPRHTPDAELVEIVNESIADLWEILVENGGDELLRINEDVTPGTTDADVIVPATFYKLTGIDLYDGANFIRKLDRTSFERRDEFQRQGAAQPRFYIPKGLAGAIVYPGDTLANAVTVAPAPDKIYTYRFHFIPEAPIFDATTDAIEFPNKWWRWVNVDVAIALKIKAEEDAGDLASLLERRTAAISRSASNVDQGRPRRVRMTRRYLSRLERRDLATYGPDG